MLSVGLCLSARLPAGLLVFFGFVHQPLPAVLALVVVKPISCLAIRADILDELPGVGSAEPDALCVQKCPSADGAQSCQGGFIHLFCGLAVHVRTPFR